MKILIKVVKIVEELRNVSKKVEYLQSELDCCVGELVDYLKNNNLIETIDVKTDVEYQEDDLDNKFENYYYCSECNKEWSEVWTSTCNDKCSICNKEIEPYESRDI